MLSTTPPPYDQFFLEKLPLIERVIAFVCRRHGCSADEAEEFDALVKLKLIEDDYARLRSWKGQSTFSTYLTTVVRRLFQDYLICRRGKWRPSEEAKRLGPVAEKLEALLSRPPTLTFDQACEVLLTNHKLDTSREALEEIARRLPVKTVRRFEGEEQLAYLPSGDAAPDEQLRSKEGHAQMSRVREAVKRALAELPPEDRLLIRMHFLDDFSVADVARRLCLEQKPLYGRIKKALAHVRQSLEREGIRWEEVEEALRGTDKGGPESV